MCRACVGSLCGLFRISIRGIQQVTALEKEALNKALSDD
jgi:hypothetical protein